MIPVLLGYQCSPREGTWVRAWYRLMQHPKDGVFSCSYGRFWWIQWEAPPTTYVALVFLEGVYE